MKKTGHNGHNKGFFDHFGRFQQKTKRDTPKILKYTETYHGIPKT